MSCAHSGRQDAKFSWRWATQRSGIGHDRHGRGAGATWHLPILIVVISVAMTGKALAVGLAIWREAGRRGTQPVKVCRGRMARDLGISPKTVRRALRELERAGLVTILRKPGRGLDVTILDASPSATDP